MSLEREKMRWMKSSFLGGIFIATLLTISLHLTNNLHLTDKLGLFTLEDEHKLNQEGKKDDVAPPAAAAANDSSCDLFSGRWVLDNASYPLYEESKCSFMEDEFVCQKYGRKNLKYQHWAWKPHACQLPRSSIHLSHTSLFHATLELVILV